MTKRMITRREALIGAAGQCLTGAAALALTSAVRAKEETGMTAKVEHLGRPCKARNVHAGVVVNDAGREWFVITNTNESANVELIFIDAASDTGHVYRAPAGSGAWALQRLPGHRLALGTYYDGMFLIFDIARREWIKTAKFPGESYLWTFALGSDGRLYGGTYPGGKLGALDLDTYAVEDLGAPGKPNLYLRHTSALPDGRIFCQFGFTKTQTQLFDPATKRFAPAPASMQAITQGVAWNGCFVAGNKAYRMPDLVPMDPLPFPAPDPRGGEWAVDVRLSTDKRLILRQGTVVYQYAAGDSGLKKVLNLRARGAGSLLAINESGDFFGIRGQDYFVLRPHQSKADLKIIPGEAAPRGTHFIRIDDRGTLWGGPTFGQTLFHMDTKTGKATNTRTVSDYGGEVYDVAVIDGICYAVAYAGGEVIRFDPQAPWDQVNHVNPKTIARVGPDYIRPSAGVTVGEDGRLYSGWLAKYGEYGGLLAITDPKTGKTETFRNPLGPHGIAGLAPVGKDMVLLGTTTYGNGLGNQKDAPVTLALWDSAAARTVWTHTFTGAAGIGSIVHDAASGLAAFLLDGKRLYLFDPVTRAVVGNGPLVEGVTAHHLAVMPGRALYAIGETLYALDLAARKSAPVAKAPSKIEKITFGGPEGHIYIACGPDIYRIQEA